MPVDPRAARWAAIDPVPLWSGVSDWFPAAPARALEVGAGTGRDAAWLAGLGYDVTCVEPDADLWPEDAKWVQSTLPGLDGVAGHYDLITISAVWHLLPRADWQNALHRLWDLSGAGGRLIISLRCPPIIAAEPVCTAARSCGWHLDHHIRHPSVQPGNHAAGVMWDWCVFTRVAPG